MDMRYGKDYRPGLGMTFTYKAWSFSEAFRCALRDGIRKSPRHPNFYVMKDEDYVYILVLEDEFALTEEGDGSGVQVVFRTVCVTPRGTRVANRMTRAAAHRA